MKHWVENWGYTVSWYHEKSRDAIRTVRLPSGIFSDRLLGGMGLENDLSCVTVDILNNLDGISRA